jgi:hypothetical protein
MKAHILETIKTKILRRMLLPAAIIMTIVFGALCENSNAETVHDSVNYKIDIGNFTGLPGGVARMPVQIKNIEPIRGFQIRITYDSNFITPYRIDPVGSPSSYYYDSLELVGRGWQTISVSGLDTSYWTFASHDTAEGSIHWNAIFAVFAPLVFEPPIPYIVAESDTVTTIFNLLFNVKSTAAIGTSSIVSVANYTGPNQDYRDNQFSDTLGDTTYLPGLGFGIFTVGENPDPCPDDTCPDTCCTVGGNHAPTVNAIVPSAYEIYQGDSVKFSVTAVDSDGDQLSLRAIGLPANAQFTPSNPVTGTASVTGYFRFLPTFAQSGNFSIDFQATDEHGAVSSIRTVSITVNVLDIDRLFTTSAYGGSPVGGIAGARDIVFPIDLATSKTVYGVQFDMAYPSLVVRIDSMVVTDRTPEYVVYENINQVPDTVRVATFGLDNEPIIDGAGSAILNAYMRIDSEATAGDYWIYFFDAWESIDPNPEMPSLALKTDSGIVQVDLLGDVNLDKYINVADLVNVVAYIIGAYGLPPRNFATANVVRDSYVNVVDLVGIINLIFGLPLSPAPAQNNNDDGLFATLKIEHDDLSSGQLTKLNVRGEFPDDIAGVQLQIDYDPEVFEFDKPELTDITGDFILAYNNDHSGRIKMALYSSQPLRRDAVIPAGPADVVYLPAHIKKDIKEEDVSVIQITEAVLSNPTAKEVRIAGSAAVIPVGFILYQNYPNPFNPDTKIEFDIKHDGGGRIEQAKLDIYNILGQHIKSLVNGDISAGRHSVSWNGTDDSGRHVSTGIYLYRLQVGDKSQTKKMLLLK